MRRELLCLRRLFHCNDGVKWIPIDDGACNGDMHDGFDFSSLSEIVNNRDSGYHSIKF